MRHLQKIRKNVPTNDKERNVVTGRVKCIFLISNILTHLFCDSAGSRKRVSEPSPHGEEEASDDEQYDDITTEHHF